MSKEKILIVGAFPKNKENKIYGGIITSCNTLLESNIVEKFDIVTLDSTQPSNPPPNLFYRSIKAIKRILSLLKILLTNKPKAVIFFIALEASLFEKGVMGWIARIFKIKVLHFPRGTRIIDFYNKSAINKFIVKNLFLGGHYFLCQGPTWQKFAINDLKFNEKNAPIIPNWTATNSLLKIGENRNFNKISNFKQLLFLGWLEKEKGIFELLDSFIKLCKKYHVQLTIAGSGSAENDIRIIIEKNNLQELVKMVGWVSGDKLKNILSSTDILILPSWSEGLPNAMIESMAAKIAVVVTNVGNIPDLLENEKHAMIIPVKDKNLLYSAIEKLLSDDKLLKFIANEGFQFAQENFSEKKSIDLFSNVIAQAINFK